MAGLQVSLIITVAVVFVTTLFGLIACLSLLRRLRNRQTLADVFATYFDETRPMSAIEDSQQFAPFIQDAKALPKRNLLPENFRLPIQPGTPDQVVIAIEPAEGPTRDQRNVQKLIEFLKQETTEAESV